MMHLRPDVGIIDCLYLTHGCRAEWRQCCRIHVILHLLRVLAARDGTGHFRKHQDPAQCKLCHGPPLRYQGTQFLNGLQTRLVLDPREGFSLVKGFAMTIETTMVVGSEACPWIEFASQESTCQPHTSQYPNLLFTCDRKKVL